MKDAKLIALFVVVGLVVAWFASAPLRRPAEAPAPSEQTARLQQEAPPADIYAEGTISVSPTVKSQAPALFIIARPAGGGAPLAVKRIAAPVFPVVFSLTLADSMAGGDFYVGDLVVIARLDADGSAGPVEPGDVESSAVVKTGQSRHVELVLGPPAS